MLNVLMYQKCLLIALVEKCLSCLTLTSGDIHAPWGPRDISVTTAHRSQSRLTVSMTVSLVSDTDNDSCNDSELTYNLILVLVSHTICVSSLGDGDVLTTALGQPCLASPCLEYCKSLFFFRKAFGGYDPYFRVWFFVMSSPHSFVPLAPPLACLRRSQDHKSSISCGRESTTSESSSVTILYDDCRGAGAAVVPQRSRTAFRCCRLARALVRPSSLCEGPALALIQAAARCECSSLCWAAGAAEVGLRTHQQHFPSLA